MDRTTRLLSFPAVGPFEATPIPNPSRSLDRNRRPVKYLPLQHPTRPWTKSNLAQLRSLLSPLPLPPRRPAVMAKPPRQQSRRLFSPVEAETQDQG
jgi:hypothetical protein